jgi:hypothetical protein
MAIVRIYNSSTSGGGGGGAGVIIAGTGTGSSYRCGLCNTASGSYSFAVGKCTTASANYSEATGLCTFASGNASKAAGFATTASGIYSYAFGKCNVASGLLSTISGGEKNLAQAIGGFIGGGECNNVCNVTSGCLAYGAVVVGGVGNNTTGGTWNLPTCTFSVAPTLCDAGIYSFVGGGLQNRATGGASTISGGCSNMASGLNSNVSGGFCNSASSSCASVGGGFCNIASSQIATISGGGSNTASGLISTISGGEKNLAQAIGGFIGGGKCNNVCNSTSGCLAFGAVVVGGVGNNTTGGTWSLPTCTFTVAPTICNAGQYSFVGGGFQNRATGNFSAISGGCCNLACGLFSTASGYCNTSNNTLSTVFGGCNINSGTRSVVAGFRNTSSASNTTISGGYYNIISGSNSFIGAGGCNVLSGDNSFIGAGLSNKTNYTFSGPYAGPRGWYDNIIGGVANCIAINLTAFCDGAFYCGGQVIGGGATNCICMTFSGSYLFDTYGYNTIAGGCTNTISSSSQSTIGGGGSNKICASSSVSTIVGGNNNKICCGFFNTIGGYLNSTSSSYTTIFGGCNIIGLFPQAAIIGNNITADRCCTLHVNNLSIKSIPTAATGLPSGAVYRLGSVLNIVP